MPTWFIAALGALAATPAPITDVTVFSDRARVTRTARVAVSGTHTAVLPLLQQSIDPASIRVEATGADVARVDLAWVEPDAMPEDEARRLLGELDKLDREIGLVREQADAHRQQEQALARITPTVPQADPLRPPPKLDPTGWTAAIAFVADAQNRLQARARELSTKLEALERKRAEVADRAVLLGGAERRGGWQVTAHLAGSGTAVVRVTYLAGPARWIPGYDLQLAPETGRLQVAFSGQVSQETGEDWSDAQLTLSTAEPASATRMPELTSWRIGDRDRFIPTPTPKPLAWRPPPPASPPPLAREDDEILRQRLMSRASGGQGQAMARPPPKPAPSAGYGGMAKQSKAYQPSAVDELSAAEADYDDAPQPSAAAEATRRELRPSARSRSAPSSPAPMAISGKPTADKRSMAPQDGFSLGPPATYRPRQYSPELPVMAAGGYDLSWPSLQKETVGSGQGARRVALFSQDWPVKVERHLFPALAPEAYLVTALKSPSPTPLPAGLAQLYVGSDPAGTARLQLVAPGETVTLPLGLDRALKPVRNVQVVNQEKGFISKDDLTRYVVRIELANPYDTPVEVKIFDQWPLTDEKEVEIKLLETKPYAVQDPVTGQLQWHLTLKPRSKTELSFTYSIRKPRGWKLGQGN